MKYEIKLNRNTLKDGLSANAISVGFKGKRTFEDIKEKLVKILKSYPLTCSKVVIEKDVASFQSIDTPYVNIIEDNQSDKIWITKQYGIPLKMDEGELIRFALLGENTFVVYYHPLLSDSRGILNFAKNVLSEDQFEESPFYFPEIKDVKLSIIDKATKQSLVKAKENKIEIDINPVKLKSVSLKSDIIFRICSGERVTMLSFFIVTALSLNKTTRKKLSIPYCRKDNYEDQLINDSTVFSFKRGFEPRLSFYENAGEIDKLFESIISKKSYEKRAAILQDVPLKYFDNPEARKKILNYLESDLQFDILPTLNEDELINTLGFYPSSSYIINNFGICAVDDRITISTVLHNKVGEEFFSDFTKTINLLSKEAAKRFKKK
jgi:hypothetical protein